MFIIFKYVLLLLLFLVISLYVYYNKTSKLNYSTRQSQKQNIPFPKASLLNELDSTKSIDTITYNYLSKIWSSNDEAIVILDLCWPGLNVSKIVHPNYQSVIFTALLPPKNKDLSSSYLKLPIYQIPIAKPTYFKIRAFTATNNIFDYLFLLRIDDLLEAVFPMTLMTLLGLVLSMSRSTILALPCTLR
eukprot:NODE_9243_length_609_cov_27.487654_g8611_i0.p1 GENE.NODE_9243_length_609_cov_27.487654_g8611_i0~~NODE_9243_length_609_cov_27.487654_g8611_i0.p1  ORF type:complete len:202 (-),score=9.87 NODE_9243_length_609_cov_27.487654_g8611_i0:3-569(-)